MKASDARAMAESKNITDLRKGLDHVLGEIKIQVNIGKFEFLYFNDLSKEVERELKKLGYKIERRDAGRNEIDIYISW